MATDINIQSLIPVPKNTEPTTDIFNTTFIGVDFGTSTSVVSIARIDETTKEITTTPIWLNQMLYDGAIMKSEKIPTVIAWYNQQLLVGKGAADLKYHLTKDVNVWYSFKMELGEDYGVKYPASELNQNSDFPILNPKDAVKVFFRYLKEQIDGYVKTNNFPSNIRYAVSIPASFEANQRKELIEALEQNGISLNNQSLIDEPNAAFLSYVVYSSSEKNPITLPDGDNPKVLVFDFGAGTCDISILELGKDLNGIYSKNLSISKFEKLGGDDIDKLIAIEYLFPQLLQENGKTIEDFRTPEKKRIITHLLKFAEQLKIMICDSVALQMDNRMLSTKAFSKEYESVGGSIKIDSRKGLLTLIEPRISYNEFNDVMKKFLNTTSSKTYKSKYFEEEFISIFSPIETALKKASLSKYEIDYVLLIGGSSKNPYVQAALKEYFKESELLVPRDLQIHVSAGAAVHSLLYNGFGKNIIQPITSEPLLLITKDKTPKVILKAGTHIPCDTIVIDDLITDQDGQKAIELPICVGNVNKLLYNIKIVCNDSQGFKRSTRVKLELKITADKLLLISATAAGQYVLVEPINPFANKELTTEQRIVLEAEREANIEAVRNNGKPTKQGLEKLYEAYEKVGYYLRAAETLEQLNELYLNVHNYNIISVLYSKAGYFEKSLEFSEKAYKYNKNDITALNYALDLKYKGDSKFKEILEEALKINPNNLCAIYEMGCLLKYEDNVRSKQMINKSFDAWKNKFEQNQLREWEYSWLASAAEELGMYDFAQQVRDARPRSSGEKMYNSDNLPVTLREARIINR